MSRERRQGLLPFEFTPDEDDAVTSWSGLTLLVDLMRQLGLPEHARSLALRERASGHDEFQLLTAFVLLFAAGGDCMDDIRPLREDKALGRLLGHGLPSPDVLRRTLERFHDEEALAKRSASGAWIAPETERLGALGRLHAVLAEAYAAHAKVGAKTATIDIDATIIESTKREALAHYKGGRGYQPVAALWAEAGVVLADQFRDGNVPAGMGNAGVVEAALAAVPTSVERVLLRADSALYEQKVLRILSARGVGFAVSADMSPELRAACVALPDKAWSVFERRSDLVVQLAEVEFTPDDAWPKDAAPLRYLALRFEQAQGRLFADGSDVKYFAVVTNRDGNAGELVRWHRQKAGTIEHLHDVTKNELGAGTLPSAKLGANAAWYRLNLLTFSVLSLLKRLALDDELKDARPKRLRLHVFAAPARVVSHARGLFARVRSWAYVRLERARAYLADLSALRVRLPAASVGQAGAVVP